MGVSEQLNCFLCDNMNSLHKVTAPKSTGNKIRILQQNDASAKKHKIKNVTSKIQMCRCVVRVNLGLVFGLELKLGLLLGLWCYIHRFAHPQYTITINLYTY